VIVGTCLAFASIGDNEFVDWDDRQNLVENDHYRGFGVENIRWMFTTNHGGHYQPLTWMSWAIDDALWRLNPTGFHLTNLLLHVLSAVLVLLIADRLLAEIFPKSKKSAITAAACLAALLFAVHPLRVESVAWATERRDVLSGCLLMLTILLYLEHGRSNRWIWLCASAMAFLLSLLSKASGMVFPVILVMLDFYPRRRWHDPDSPGFPGELKRSIQNKALFIVPAGVFAILAAGAQTAAGAMWTLAEHPLSLRVAQAFYGLVFYPLRTLLPLNLSPLYEQSPAASAGDWPNIVSLVIVMAVSLLAWRWRRRHPWLLTCWVAYAVIVSPMLGLAQSGPQLVADRYSYLACIPFAMAIAAGLLLAPFPATSHRRRELIACVAIVVLMALTYRQVGVWRNSRVLWETVINRGTSSGIANANLASILNSTGEFESACERAKLALQTLPGNRTAHLARGKCLLAMGAVQESRQHFERAIEIDSALSRFDSGPWLGLATVEASLGRIAEAESCYRVLTERQPANAAWHFHLASLLAAHDRTEEAITGFHEAIRRDPAYSVASLRQSILLAGTGRCSEGIAVLLPALEHDTGNRDLSLQLAWLLATCPDNEARNGRLAFALVTTTLEVEGHSPSHRDMEVKAAVLAENGQFQDAELVLRQVLDNAQAWMAKPADLDRYRIQLSSYANQLPWRIAPQK
jgi:tetratricopeptide (TPR) repeat protein